MQKEDKKKCCISSKCCPKSVGTVLKTFYRRLQMDGVVLETWERHHLVWDVDQWIWMSLAPNEINFNIDKLKNKYRDSTKV